MTRFLSCHHPVHQRSSGRLRRIFVAHHVHPRASCWFLSRRVGRPLQFTVCERHCLSFRQQMYLRHSLQFRSSSTPCSCQQFAGQSFGATWGVVSSTRGVGRSPRDVGNVARVTNPERRPLITRQEVSREVAEPAVSFTFDQDLFLISLRRVRREGGRGQLGGSIRNDRRSLFPRA